ncbi:MAG: dihydroneopterin aldolase [Flavobacteriaceae bacterium]
MIIFADRMGKIFVKNIRLYAYHGCLEEESKIGSDYLVNLTVETDLEKSSGTDDLKDTVDYVALHALAKEEMGKRAKLLETVVLRLAKKILKQHREVSKAIVKVAKLNPPIGGNVEEVAVEIELSRSSLDFGE